MSIMWKWCYAVKNVYKEKRIDIYEFFINIKNIKFKYV